MTLNERLLEAGLMEEFDAAVRARDRERIVVALMRVALPAEEAGLIADKVLAKPKYYGF